jgi:hypothetical protein
LNYVLQEKAALGGRGSVLFRIMGHPEKKTQKKGSVPDPSESYQIIMLIPDY